MSWHTIRGLGIIFGLIICAVAAVLWRSFTFTSEIFPEPGETDIYSILRTGASGTLPYIMWLASEENSRFKDAPLPGIAATELAVNYSAASPDALVHQRYDDMKQANVLEWNNAKGWVEWQVYVPADGLYDLIIDYCPLKGSFSQIVRGIQIDGVYPFAEADQIGFDRAWQDSIYPYERNSIGNEIRPVQNELATWNAARVADYSISSEPLRWKLESGNHTIRLVGVKEPISLYSITLASPEAIPSYLEYRELYPDSGGTKEWFQRIEAERFKQKSAVKIRTLSVSEPYTSPDPQGRLVYNAIGGDYWQNPGQSIEWELTVPENGYYAIDLKFFQGYNGKSSVYRTIKIDGKVPFKEMLHYRFAPNSVLEIKPLADHNGDPFLFYLTAGSHRFSMIVDNSPVRPVIIALNQINRRLTEMEWEVRMISGNYGFGSAQNLDQNRVWEMSKYDPDIEFKLRSISDDMRWVRDFLNGLNQAITDPATALSIAISRLEELLSDINELPNKVTVFSDIKSSINTWMKPIENQPLQLDFLVVRTPQTDPGYKVPNVWDKVLYSMTNFFRTFVQTYDTKESNDEDALTIWVLRGRDYVDLLQLMIEQDFTPATGIAVNVNLIPSQNVLLMSIAAGKQPDLALGVGMETPVDYAMRGASQDLTVFPGFEAVLSRFNPGVMRSYEYNGRIYGLPETQNYNMMFYRKDIFTSLGLQPPDTWQDVLTLLPTLQENGMTFMFPRLPSSSMSNMTSKPDFILPYYQHGAEFYSADGLMPQLTSDRGLAAFKQWTDWYSKYDLPKDVPAFFNHFRFGDIPIGVDDISVYMQLEIAAPELGGHWAMLPLPGTPQLDGSIPRWSALGTTSAVMLKESKKKEQAWSFLEWWTSDEIQSLYGNDIESFAGIEYRWHTANINALQTLPWTEDDLAALNEQIAWAKNMPFVPGYYFLPREMDFAWNETVLGGTPPKEALEQAQQSLLREMIRKQAEFGITSEDHLIIKPYNVPYRPLP